MSIAVLSEDANDVRLHTISRDLCDHIHNITSNSNPAFYEKKLRGIEVAFNVAALYVVLTRQLPTAHSIPVDRLLKNESKQGSPYDRV